MSKRGEIRNREYSTQVNDFSGLLFGKITPTDVDMFVEFGDKLFIFGEIKYDNADMPYGQELALVRICDAVYESGRESVLLVISHNDEDGDVNVARALVVKYRYEKRWHIPQKKTTVLEAIEHMKKWITND
jgi:hypothetical protein